MPLQSSINCYWYCFVNTAFLWNSVPAHILKMNSVALSVSHFIVIFVHNYSCNSSCYCNYFIVDVKFTSSRPSRAHYNPTIYFTSASKNLTHFVKVLLVKLSEMLHSSNFVRLFHRQSFALYGI